MRVRDLINVISIEDGHGIRILPSLRVSIRINTWFHYYFPDIFHNSPAHRKRIIADLGDCEIANLYIDHNFEWERDVDMFGDEYVKTCDKAIFFIVLTEKATKKVFYEKFKGDIEEYLMSPLPGSEYLMSHKI